MNYESDHPLYERTAEQISNIAELAASFDRSPRNGYVRMLPHDIAAIIHEFERLKSEVIAPSLLDNRFAMQEWLTRAIELSGAPEGSDWAGLLQVVAELKSQAGMMQTLATDIDAEIPGPANWWGENGTVIRARKLRERAEAAEAKVDALECRIYTGNPKKDYIDKLEDDVAALKAAATPTTLTQIAADVARIAATLDKQREPTHAPYIHTQSDGRYDRD